jgi:hypothetical protein
MTRHSAAVTGQRARPPSDSMTTVGTAVIMELANGSRASFVALLHATQAGQSALAAALAQLRGDGFLLQRERGDFLLSARGRDLIAAARRSGRRHMRNKGSQIKRAA